MLDSNTIMNNLLKKPHYKKISKSYCYNKFINSLSPKYQKAIAFVYVKEKTLFIALSHPGFKMELNYHLDSFKYNVNLIQKHDKKCIDIKVNKVILFNSNKKTILKDIKILSTVPYYKELSYAFFEINSKDSEISEKFENIKKAISCNRR